MGTTPVFNSYRKASEGHAFFFCAPKRRYLDHDTLPLVTATRPVVVELALRLAGDLGFRFD